MKETEGKFVYLLRLCVRFFRYWSASVEIRGSIYKVREECNVISNLDRVTFCYIFLVGEASDNDRYLAGNHNLYYCYYLSCYCYLFIFFLMSVSCFVVVSGNYL